MVEAERRVGDPQSPAGLPRGWYFRPAARHLGSPPRPLVLLWAGHEAPLDE